jgi:hypothetical protein
MTLVRSLLADLVEKRLWPIALLLAITAIAVPVVLGRSGAGAGAPAAPPATAAADGAAPATPAVEIVGPAAVRGRSGPVRDPFRRSTKAAAKTGDARAVSVYRARVRWGQDQHAAVRGLSRLEALGGSSNPGLLYLGTTQRGARAVFLLGPNASADGDGTCAEKTCRVLRLKAGETAVVTVQGGEGTTPQRFELVIDAIARRGVTSEAAARKLRARVDRDGRDVLREIIKDSATAAAIGQFRFARTLGAVVATTAP